MLEKEENWSCTSSSKFRGWKSSRSNEEREKLSQPKSHQCFLRPKLLKAQHFLTLANLLLTQTQNNLQGISKNQLGGSRIKKKTQLFSVQRDWISKRTRTLFSFDLFDDGKAKEYNVSWLVMVMVMMVVIEFEWVTWQWK